MEDHEDIAMNVKKYLELENYEVDIAFDGLSGMAKFNEIFYDLVLLDIMMPLMDGISVLKKIRETREVPIIMLTAKGQLEDKLEGFDGGADDYLVKPFDLEELSVRIRAIMKRFDEPEKYVYGDVEVFLDQKKVLKAGKDVKLTNKEILILEQLFENKGVVLSRADILEYVWGGDLFENDDKLDVYISNLRRKVGKNVIETVKGVGYRVGN